MENNYILDILNKTMLYTYKNFEHDAPLPC